MTTADAIAWFKRTFADRIEARLAGTPFSVDLVAAIANQETGYIWAPLVTKGFSESDILRLCVGDTLDADRGRSCFPRNKAELLAAPRGAEMFAIARQALLDMASHVNGYEAATINPNKFCHGYGIFQYDIQFYRENPAYFLQKRWADFDACLTQFLDELKQAAKRQGWANKTSLSDEERVFVAIAYNRGKADCSLGFKQGHKCDGRCYGENVYDFFRLAQSIAVNGAAVAVRLPALPIAQPSASLSLFKKIGVVYEVDVEEVPLRLRSEPQVSAPNPGANVIARLPRGQLVQQVSRKKTGEFLEIETTLNGAALRGFASSKFLRRVERARRVTPSSKTPGRVAASALGSTTENKAKRKEANVAAPPPTEPGDKLAKSMDIEAIIRAVQKELGLGVDGKAGPRTWKAIYLKIKGKEPEDVAAPITTKNLPPSATGSVDPRSEKTIATLQPEVRPYARTLVQKAAAVGITIKVISGLRTYDEQNALYAQGRSKPGSRVTNAQGGFSNHNFGIAFDIGVFKGANYIPESAQYKVVGALGMEIGLEWGGNWKTIKDEPHFQLRPSWAAQQAERDMLAELRARKASGRGYYA